MDGFLNVICLSVVALIIIVVIKEFPKNRRGG